MPAKDATLYAAWQQKVGLSFDANGGSESAPPSIEGKYSGDTVILPDYSGTREGYNFIGWAEVAKLTQDSNYRDVYSAGESFVLPAKDLTLYAAWTPADQVVKVEFTIRKDNLIP